LPPWIASRVLRPGEEVTWVRGPRRNPSWEPCVTHPLLFVAALALGVILVGTGIVAGGGLAGLPLAAAAPAGGVILGSIFVLGIGHGYFTRLVVTNLRIFIVQGYEVCRSWRLEDLPPSLLCYAARGASL